MKNRFFRVLLTSLVMLSFIMTASAYGADTADQTAEQQELTLAEAVQRALQESNTLDKQEQNIEDAENRRDDAQADFDPNWITDYSPDMDEPYQALLSSRSAVDTAKLNYTVAKDQITYGVMQQYYGILDAQTALDEAQMDLEAAQANYQRTERGYEVGIRAYSEVEDAQSSLSSAERSLSQAQQALDSAYRNFDRLLNLPVDERPVLVDVPELVPLTEGQTLALFTSWAKDASPAIEIAKDNAQLQALLQGWGNNTQEDTGNADADVTTAKESTEDRVYSLYYQVKDLETQYTLQQQNIDLLAGKLSAAQTRYSLGLITQDQVDQADTAWKKAQMGMTGLAAKHTLAKYLLEKPWAG